MVSLLSGSWTKINSGFQILKDSSASLSSLTSELKIDPKNEKNKSKNTKKGKKSSQDERTDMEESLYALGVVVMKFKLLWGMIDCRKLSKEDYNDLTDQLIEIADVTVTICEEINVTNEIEKICTLLSVDCMHIVQSILGWVVRDAYVRASELNNIEGETNNVNKNKYKMITDNSDKNDNNENENENENKNENENEVDLEISDSCDIILSLREKLIDVLLTWMSLGSSSSQDSDEMSVREIHRTLQRESFSMIGTIRALFPIKINQYKFVDKLYYTPSQDVLAGLRKVFEFEGGRIKMELNKYNDIIAHFDEINDGRKNNNGDNNSENQKKNENENQKLIAIQESENLIKILVNSLLIPLSNSLMYDIENLNRRQAAAVLCYYSDASPVIQDTVKNMIKCLRENDIVKYLEVQMVALKSFYSENVVNKLKEKQMLEEESMLEDYLEAERIINEVSLFSIC